MLHKILHFLIFNDKVCWFYLFQSQNLYLKASGILQTEIVPNRRAVNNNLFLRHTICYWINWNTAPNVDEHFLSEVNLCAKLREKMSQTISLSGDLPGIVTVVNNHCCDHVEVQGRLAVNTKWSTICKSSPEF